VGPTTPGSYFGPGVVPPGAAPRPTTPGSYFGPGVVPPGATVTATPVVGGRAPISMRLPVPTPTTTTAAGPQPGFFGPAPATDVAPERPTAAADVVVPAGGWARPPSGAFPGDAPAAQPVAPGGGSPYTGGALSPDQASAATEPGSFPEAHPDSTTAVALKVGGGAALVGGLVWAISKQFALSAIVKGMKGGRRR